MRLALIIPALDESQTIREVLAQVPAGLFSQIIVVDNGSRDGTAELARAAGVEVVVEQRRGYGQACLAGLSVVHPETTAVAFMDADLSDDPGDLQKMVATLVEGEWDMVIGSRVLGTAEPGSLMPLQRFGNWLSTTLIHALWGVRFTDLGPLRIVTCAALRRLDVGDPTYGWNIEMQAKAARLRLRVTEIPVNYRRRQSGKSKISGTLVGSAKAGIKILATIYRCWREHV